MDGFSLIIGGMLGGLAGWAFSSATAKQREASKFISEALKAEEKMVKMEGEAKTNKRRRVAEMVQGFALYLLGFMLIVLMTIILFSSLL